MNLVDVTIKIDQADKDVIDAAVIAYKDIVAKKAANLLQDEVAELVKIGGELADLKSSLNTKGAAGALAYLDYQFAQ